MTESQASLLAHRITNKRYCHAIAHHDGLSWFVYAVVSMGSERVYFNLRKLEDESIVDEALERVQALVSVARVAASGGY